MNDKKKPFKTAIDILQERISYYGNKGTTNHAEEKIDFAVYNELISILKAIPTTDTSPSIVKAITEPLDDYHCDDCGNHFKGNLFDTCTNCNSNNLTIIKSTPSVVIGEEIYGPCNDNYGRNKHPLIREETVEEAADRQSKNSSIPGVQMVSKSSFIRGAHWQSTRMYSEQQQWIDENVCIIITNTESQVKKLHEKYRGEFINIGFNEKPLLDYGTTWNWLLKNGKISGSTGLGSLNNYMELCPNVRILNFNQWHEATAQPNSTNVSAPTFTEQQVIDLLENMKVESSSKIVGSAGNIHISKQSILSIDTKQFINDNKK